MSKSILGQASFKCHDCPQRKGLLLEHQTGGKFSQGNFCTTAAKMELRAVIQDKERDKNSSSFFWVELLIPSSFQLHSHPLEDCLQLHQPPHQEQIRMFPSMKEMTSNEPVNMNGQSHWQIILMQCATSTLTKHGGSFAG